MQNSTDASTSDCAMSDNELVVLHQQNLEDTQYFTLLYERTRAQTFNLCFRMTGSRATAEDLSQDVYLKVYRKIGTFRGDSRFTTWLHRLTVTTVLMHLREKKSRLQTVSMEDLSIEPGDDYVPIELGTDDHSLASAALRVTLERRIEKLPAGYQRAIVLHDIKGYEHPEIAAITKRSIGNSKSQLAKARGKLREGL